MNDNVYSEIKEFQNKIKKVMTFHDNFNKKLKISALIDGKIIEEDKFNCLKNEEVTCDKDLSSLLSNIGNINE